MANPAIVEMMQRHRHDREDDEHARYEQRCHLCDFERLARSCPTAGARAIRTRWAQSLTDAGRS